MRKFGSNSAWWAAWLVLAAMSAYVGLRSRVGAGAPAPLARLVVPSGHTVMPEEIRFSADGGTVVSADRAGRIVRWDVVLATPRNVVDHGSRAAIRLNHDGSTALVLGTELSAIDTRTGRTLWRRPNSASLNSRAQLAADRPLAVLRDDQQGRRYLESLDLHTGQTLQRVVCTPDIERLAVAPDAAYLAGLDADGGLWRWDIARLDAPPRRLGRSLTHARLVVISPGVPLVAMAAEDRLEVWDLRSGRRLHATSTDNEAVTSLSFTDDGRRLVVASGSSGAVKVRDARTGAIQQTVSYSLVTTAVCLSAQEILATGLQDGSLKLQRLGEARELADLPPAARATLGHLVMAADGHLVGGMTKDGVVCLWPADQPRPRQMFRLPLSPKAVAMSPDGRQLALALPLEWRQLSPASVHLVDVRSQSFTPLPLKVTGGVTQLRYEASGRWLAVGGADGGVQLWDRQREAAGPSFTHGAALTDLQFLDSGRLATSGADLAICVWRLEDGRQMQRIAGSGAGASHLAALPDGRLVSGDAAGRLHFWRSGSLLDQVVPAQDEPIVSLAASPDGRLIATGGAALVRVFDAASGAQLHQLKGHRGAVQRLAWHPDGRLFSTGGDGTLRVWDPQGGRWLATLSVLHYSQDNRPAWLAQAPGGYYAAGGRVRDDVRWDRAFAPLSPAQRRPMLLRPRTVRQALIGG